MRETPRETILVKHVKRSRKVREAHKRMQSFRRVEEEIKRGPSLKVRELALLLLGVEMKTAQPGEAEPLNVDPGRIVELRALGNAGSGDAAQNLQDANLCNAMVAQPMELSTSS